MVFGTGVHPLLISLLCCNYHCIEAPQIIRNWVAICAEHHIKGFAWNSEQKNALAEMKHMASILLQFLKIIRQALVYFLGLCSFVFCLNEKLRGWPWEAGMQAAVGLSHVWELISPSASSPLLFLKIKKKMFLKCLIDFWLHAVSAAAHRRSLVVVCGLLIAVSSLVAEHGL